MAVATVAEHVVSTQKRFPLAEVLYVTSPPFSLSDRKALETGCLQRISLSSVLFVSKRMRAVQQRRPPLWIVANAVPVSQWYLRGRPLLADALLLK